MELLAIKNHRAVLAAKENIAVTSGSLAMYARAFGGLRKELALLIQMLDGVALVLGSTTEPSFSGTATPWCAAPVSTVLTGWASSLPMSSVL